MNAFGLGVLFYVAIGFCFGLWLVFDDNYDKNADEHIKETAQYYAEGFVRDKRIMLIVYTLIGAPTLTARLYNNTRKLFKKGL